ncbi:MAG: hypothetical protein GF401_12530 [Chitinivibrionales bacterium]|nr:hypothetical protein [Chitinivibrionales bacterium]
MSIKYFIIAPLVFAFLLLPANAEYAMTQLDTIVPPGLNLCDSIARFSSSVRYPGYRNDSSVLNIATGFLKNHNNSPNYVWHPPTMYDNVSGIFSSLEPFIAAEKSFGNTKSGIYLGNFHTNKALRNALHSRDSIYKFASNKKNNYIRSDFGFELSPFNIQYTPHRKIAVSITPALSKELVASGFEINYRF